MMRTGSNTRPSRCGIREIPMVECGDGAITLEDMPGWLRTGIRVSRTAEAYYVVHRGDAGQPNLDLGERCPRRG
jgi:hypothetical protein